jgi:hypothetical protein
VDTLRVQALDVRRPDDRRDLRNPRGRHQAGVGQPDQQLAEVEAQRVRGAERDVDDHERVRVV